MNTLKIEVKKGVAYVQLDQGKVNAINWELAKELNEVFTNYATDDAIKGVILMGRPHGFSAGLDVVALVEDGKEGVRKFWNYYLSAMQSMIRFPKPMVCAITGYAPAGATILTLTADYRVMGKGEKHVIGMHEFKMSMQIPEMLCDIFAYQLGEKVAWEAVQKASLFSSDQAKEIGLVDESVEVEEVVERAEKHMEKLTNVYLPVFARSKAYFRKDLLAKIDREIEPMIEVILADWDDPFCQQMLQMFTMSLKK